MTTVTDEAPDASAPGPAVPPGTTAPPLRRDPLALAALLLPVVPLVVAAVAARSQDWWPASDLSLIDLRVRDVGSGDTPLLGPFSRFDWSHPGPLMFWLLAPAYRLLGATATAGLAAAALQNAVVVVGIGLVAHRLGGRRLLLVTSLVVVALLRAMDGELLASTWNPWLALLPFALFLLLTWGVARDDLTLVPWAVAAGSFLVQTHVGYGALVGALGAWGVAWVVVGAVRARRAGPEAWTAHRRRLVRVGGISVLVAAVLWSGPLVDQATEDPGNARAIATYFRDPPGEPVGFGVAADVTARELSPVGPWLGGPEPLDFLARLQPTSPLLAVPFALAWVAAAVVAWRRRDEPALLLLGTAAVGIAAGALATSRITDQPYFYLFRWWWVLAMVGWLAIAWALVRALPGTPPPTASDHREPARGTTAATVWRPLAPGLVAATAVLAVAASLGATDPVPEGTHETAVEAITPPLLDRLEPATTYELQPAGFSWFEELFGLANQLDRAGVDVVLGDGFAAHVGSGRTVGEAGPGDEVLVVATGTAVEDALAAGTDELLAEWDPLTAEERAELERLQREQAQNLIDAGLPEEVSRVENAGIAVYATVEPAIDPAAADRIAELLDRGVRVAVLRVTGDGAAGPTPTEVPDGPAPAAG